MNKEYYVYLCSYIFLIMDIFTLIMPSNGIYKSINYYIVIWFIILHFSFLVLYIKEIYKGIKSRNYVSINYWLHIFIYLLGYIFLLLNNYNNYYGIICSILFIIGTLALLYSSILNGDLYYLKNTNTNILKNEKLYIFWGSIYSLIGSIVFSYSISNDSPLAYKFVMICFVIARIYLLAESKRYIK